MPTRTETLPPDELRGVRRITLFWIGRLGDFLITTPVLRSIRQRFPDAHITIILGERGEEAASLCPDIDERLTLCKAHHVWTNGRLGLKLLTSPADLFIELNTAFSRVSALLTRITRSRIKIAFERPQGNNIYTHLLSQPTETEHMLDRYARLARALGAEYDPTPRIRLNEMDLRQARDILQSLTGSALANKSQVQLSSNVVFEGAPEDTKWIAIHPGNFKKFDNRWPEENFAELTRRLSALNDLRLVYLSGPGEEAQVAEIISHVGTPILLLPSMSLGVTAAFLSLMDLAILNVTGTAHLAVAVGTPTFTFRSRYTDTIWMPRARTCKHATSPAAPGEYSRGGSRAVLAGMENDVPARYDRPALHYAVVSDSWESCRDISVDSAWQALTDVLKALPRHKAAAG